MKPLVFISHSSNDKIVARSIKGALESIFDIEGFVAHEDIEVTDHWRGVIRSNLNDCDAMVVLVSENSKASLWVNQEVGIAMNGNILTIPIMMDIKPFGFLNDIQGDWLLKKEDEWTGREEWDFTDCAKTIVLTLLKKGPTSTIKRSLIDRVKTCTSYPKANALFEVINLIQEFAKFSPNEVEEILINSAQNHQVYRARTANWVIKRLMADYDNDIDAQVIEAIKSLM